MAAVEKKISCDPTPSWRIRKNNPVPTISNTASMALEAPMYCPRES
ncbi:uncharacterized protein METZ01_LOCUS302789, partial [marine metagenome]